MIIFICLIKVNYLDSLSLIEVLLGVLDVGGKVN